VRFAFSDEQRAFQRTARELFERECPAARVREAWTSESGRTAGLWRRLGEVGLTAVTVPEAHGGLGGGPLDWVLLLEEAGRAALPEPLAATVAVAAPLLAAAEPGASAELAARWLPRIATGEARVAVGFLELTPLVPDARGADLILLVRGGEVFAVEPAAARLRPHASVDGARRLSAIDWQPEAATRVGGADAAALAFSHAALATAAELLGLGRRLVELTVEYAKVRQQFGQAIGAFQAVKHQLADALVALEFARPMVHRATATVQPADVSMAKAAASDAASLAARAALQCHGAIGYSYESDLHLWMKRVWALAQAHGDARWHRARVADHVLDGGAHG
jgi:alkylation response protein AidB-like acyl-CoA dehydrogenase